LDFTDLDYISSAGIRVLMMMVKATGEGGVRVAHVRPNVREAIDMTGLGEFLTAWEEG
jgi:anti-anti-sigma factor